MMKLFTFSTPWEKLSGLTILLLALLHLFSSQLLDAFLLTALFLFFIAFISLRLVPPGSGSLLTSVTLVQLPP